MARQAKEPEAVETPPADAGGDSPSVNPADALAGSILDSSPPDPSGAVADLDGPPVDPGAEAAPEGAPAPKRSHKAKGGRPKGAKTRGGKYRTRADILRELEALQAAQPSDPDAPPRDPEKDAAQAVEGMFLVFSQAIGGTAWAPLAVNEKEAKQLGDVWAPCLAPYMSTVGDSLPWLVAVGATAQIFYPKYREAERLETKRLTVEAEDVSGTDEPPTGGA